jgi:hypothetical protein
VASLLDDPRFNADCRERAAESEAERSKFDEMLEASAQKWAAKSPLQKVLGWAESVMHYFEEEQDEMLPLIREEQRKELARIKGLNAAVPQAAPPVIPITPVPPKPKLLEFNFDENEVAA